jgi:hypothetical protein
MGQGCIANIILRTAFVERQIYACGLFLWIDPTMLSWQHGNYDEMNSIISD